MTTPSTFEALVSPLRKCSLAAFIAHVVLLGVLANDEQPQTLANMPGLVMAPLVLVSVSLVLAHLSTFVCL